MTAVNAFKFVPELDDGNWYLQTSTGRLRLDSSTWDSTGPVYASAVTLETDRGVQYEHETDALSLVLPTTRSDGSALVDNDTVLFSLYPAEDNTGSVDVILSTSTVTLAPGSGQTLEGRGDTVSMPNDKRVEVKLRYDESANDWRYIYVIYLPVDSGEDLVKTVNSFADLLTTDLTGYNYARNLHGDAVGDAAGAEYYRTGNTDIGSLSSGNELVFFDVTGAEFAYRPTGRGYNVAQLGFRSGNDSYAAANSAVIARLSQHCEDNGSMTIYVPIPRDGDYWPLDERMKVHSTDSNRLTIEGDGAKSHLRVVRTTGSNGGQMSLLMLGNFKASGQAGNNLLAGDSYALDSISSGDHLVTLSTPADASNFSVGMPVRVWATSIYTTYSSYARLDIVEAVDGVTGEIRLRYAASDDVSSPLIAPGDGSDVTLTDWNSDVSRIVVGFTLRKLGVSVANSIMGIFQGGANLECKVEDVHIYESEDAFVGNGFAHFTARNITGKVNNKAINAAYFSHDSVFRGFDLSCGAYEAAVDTTQNIVQMEENAFNVKVLDSRFVVGGNGGISYCVRFTKAASFCLVDGCSFVGAGATGAAVIYSFPNDDDFPKNNNDVRGCNFDLATGVSTIISTSVHANQVGFDLSSSVKDCVARAPAGTLIANIGASGLTVNGLTLPVGGDQINHQTAGTGKNKFLNITSAEEVTLNHTAGTRPVVRAIYGPSSEHFLAGGICGNSLNSNSNTANTVLDTATFAAYGSGPAHCFQENDVIRIWYAGNVDDSVGGNKTLRVRINGTATKDFTVSFTGSEEGLFLFDMRLSLRSNNTVRLQGYTLKNTTITEVNDSFTMSTSADSTIEIIGWVGNTNDNFDAQWEIEPKRFTLN